MSAMVSQITGVSSVCSTICSAADQRKHHISVSLVIGGFPSQRVSNAENISIWWRHNDSISRQDFQKNTMNIYGTLTKPYYATYIALQPLLGWVRLRGGKQSTIHFWWVTVLIKLPLTFSNFERNSINIHCKKYRHVNDNLRVSPKGHDSFTL